MPPTKNLGNVVGLVRGQTPPSKTYILWGKVNDPNFPDIVELHYYDGDTGTWLPIKGNIEQIFLETTFDQTSGGFDEYSGSLGHSFSSYAKGLVGKLTVDQANSNPVKINVNGNGLQALKKSDGAGGKADLDPGDLLAGTVYSIVYDGTDWQLLLVGQNLSQFRNDVGYIVDLSSFTTDDLAEGAANLYFTDARAISALMGEDISMFNNDMGYLTQADLNTKIDSTQQSLYTDEWHPSEWIDTTLFSQVEEKTVQNSSFESLVGPGVGTMDLPVGYLVPGKKLEIKARGGLALGSGDQLNIRVEIGGSGFDTGNVFGSLTPSDNNWEIRVDMLARGNGDVLIAGFIRIINGSGSESVAQIAQDNVGIDYGADQLIDLQALLTDPNNDIIRSDMLTLSKKA